MKRLTAGVILVVLVLGVPMLQFEPGDFWVGVAVICSARDAGCSPGQTAALGVMGVAHSAMHGAAWGAIAGPWGMAIGGAAAGL